MSAPILDRPPTTEPASNGRRSRRPVVFLTAAAALVLATALGVSLALATRPEPSPVPAATGIATDTSAIDRTAGAAPEQRSEQPATREQGTPGATPEQPAGNGGGNGNGSPALADGTHEAYITKVDRANDRIVVDVVQVFRNDDAVKAAIADGRSREEAQYLHTWVRNQNPRLRTVPLADNLRIQLVGACEEPKPSRDVLLAQLARNASQKGTYYYTLAVSDGSVQRITEHLAINAC
jgi:hypothetical protein